MPRDFTTAEIAMRWGCSMKLVQRWIKQGRLEAVKVGHIWTVSSRAKRPKPLKPYGLKQGDRR